VAWATLAEVADFPSPVEVTQAHIDLAQDMIEIHAGTTEQASDDGLIGTRNLRLLNRAVTYQAIFIANHPEILTSHDVSSAAADGVTAQYRTADAQLYAPMATRCVNRLSWRMAGIRVQRRERLLSDRGNRDSAVRDDRRPWVPL
jgi:hypothetical protein